MAHSRSVIWLCASAGTIVGGFIPDLWGAGAFSGVALLFSGVGGVAGLWAGLRLVDV